MKKILKWTIILVLVLAVVGAGGLAGIFYYFGRDLPQMMKRDDFDPPQMSRIYSADGEVIGEFFTPGAKRTVVPEDKIPVHLKHAFMAAEDADFMIHEGIDYLGMVRAFYYAVRYDAGVKGTSTITQQVVKNLILTPERSIARKVREIILAREIEKNLSKEDILYLYLNTIYLGHGVNGVEEASWNYFGKPVSEVTLAEAALLAGLTQSPERLTPFRHEERAKKRRSYVLKQLWQKGFITEAEYREAEETKISVVPYSETFPHLDAAPHFVEHVRKNLVEKYGEEKLLGGGLRVHTTLIIENQKDANRAVHEGLRTYDERQTLYRPKRKLKEDKIADFRKKIQKSVKKRGIKNGRMYDAVVTKVDGMKVTVGVGDTDAKLQIIPKARIMGEECGDKGLEEILQRGHVIRSQIQDANNPEGVYVRFAPGPEAALVSINPANRHVVAMVGGFDFESNKYDHSTQAKRQTGSTFKPFVYGAALESKTITPASIYLDSPAVFKLTGGKSWSPKNSDGKWRGPIRIREALGASRNVVAVRILKDLGLDKAQDFANRLGIKTQMVDNFTMVMGSTELSAMEITNAYATLASGGMYAEPVFVTRIESLRGEAEEFKIRPERVISEEVAFLTTSLMTSVIAGYTDASGTRRGGTASSLAALGRPAAGKTGTTNEARDAWFIGFVPQLVTGVWVGHSDNKSLGRKEYGGKVAGPIWLNYMSNALEGTDPQEFAPPATGIVTANIDPKTGKLAREGGIEEYFLSGSAPTEYAPTTDGTSSSDFLIGQFGE